MGLEIRFGMKGAEFKTFLKRKFSHPRLVLGFFTFWFVYFSVFWGRVYYFDDVCNLLARHVGVWGDWAIHLTMGSAGAFRDLFPSESPILVGAPYRYPFFSNFLSALLIKSGLPFFTCFTVPSFFFCLFFVGCLFLFYQYLFKDNLIAVISSFIFLLNGGVGFLYFFKDIFVSSSPVRTLLFPPRTYTNIEPLHIKWTSVIDTMIIPQRAFQLGFPMALLILVVLYSLFFPTPGEKEDNNFFSIKKNKVGILKLSIGGILFGILPIAHIHSFVSLVLIVPFMALADLLRFKGDQWKARSKPWVVLFLVTAVLAVPISLRYDLFGGGPAKGIQWLPGWYANEWKINFPLFWLKNWGLTPLLAILGYSFFFRRIEKKKDRLVSVVLLFPYLLLFILSNLFQFHPWIWDNTKFLVWTSVAVSGYAGYFVCWVARGTLVRA